MTDLFDSVAAQALNLGLTLRPRTRSRFEPGIEIGEADAPDAMALDVPTPPSIPKLADRRAEPAVARSPADNGAVHPYPPMASSPLPDQPLSPTTETAPRPQSHRSAGPVVPPPMPDAAGPVTEPTDDPAEPTRLEPQRASFIVASVPPAPTNGRQAAPLGLTAASSPPRSPPPVSSGPSPSSSAGAQASAVPGRAPPPTPAVTPMPERSEAPPPLSPAPTSRKREPDEPPPPAVKPATAGFVAPPPEMPSIRDQAVRITEPARHRLDLPPVSADSRSRRSSHGPAAVAPEAVSPAAIEITIGRLEIRAEAPSPPRASRPFQPQVDLETYRKRREQRS